MKMLIRYLKGYMREAAAAPLCKFLEALAELMIPIVLAQIIDKVIPSGDTGGVYFWGGMMLLIGGVGFMFAISGQFLAAKAGMGYGTNLRRAMYKHINSFSYFEIDSFGTESLITRITSDIRQTQAGVTMFMRLVLRAPFLIIGAIIGAVIISPLLSLIFIGAAVIIAVVLYFIMSRSGKYYRTIQKDLDKIGVLTRENLTGTRVVRAFSRQDEENRDFEKEADTLATHSKKAGIISGLLNPLTTVFINAAVILVIYLGGINISAGSMTAGQVLALINYLFQIQLALVVLANLMVTFSKASASAKRINEIFNKQTSLTFPECEPLTPIEGAPRVKFNSVSFDYPASSALDIEGISIEILKNQTVGVIGSTAAGKSTFVNLLCRFYDALSGTVEIDGHPIKDYPKKQLRNKIGIAPQTAVLFWGTIRENIRWGKPDATDEEIYKALKIAQAYEFVMNLGGLDFEILQGAKNLSGGQRQRLTVARAVVKNPEILILDDSSSALDYATDLKLRMAIKNELKDTTLLMVSQRATSLKNADQILVLEEGRTAGLGTHTELLKSCPVYQEICDSQG